MASDLIITLGLALGRVGLTLNSMEGSGAHLGFFLATVLAIYARVPGQPGSVREVST